MAEAFAPAIEHADSIRDPLPWIYRTAFRLSAAELRRERARPREAEADASEAPRDLEELMQGLSVWGAVRLPSPAVDPFLLMQARLA
jgi:hypothetical protein